MTRFIAIHNSTSGFHPRWIEYCRENKIPFKLVNCYSNDIIDQLENCNGLLCHFHHNNPKDILFAKQLLFSLQQAGKKVFPDFNTMWHFDDKLGQKYLLEAVGAPLVPTYIFYNKADALKWIEKTNFPKVFKLRGGAGSANVQLVQTKNQAVKLIKKAFGKGFKNYDAWSNLKERWRRYRLNKTNLWDVIKGIIRLGYEPQFSKIMGREVGYVYFQDFIPNNDHDIRVIVIGNKAFAIKRMVRKNDFRASGSGNILYDKQYFDDQVIKLSFDIHVKLKGQCTAMDFVYKDDNPLLVEVSYGFAPEGYEDCPGYWDENLNWHEGKFDPYGWMVENILKDA